MSETVRDAAQRLARLRADLPRCMLRDQERLRNGLKRLDKRRGEALERELGRLEGLLERSRLTAEARRESVPEIRYAGDLPVQLRRDELAAAIQESPVTIVAGATGSGKSTQLPKICLELGRGVTGLIGHTQPRRIAAQSLANRISEEIGTTCGDLVGYQIRFVDRSSPRTLVKLMTDGLLLRELESDPLLLRYDTLIIDEAHERNLNVDFLLGVCRRLLLRRPELRVIVASATIETERFARYFEPARVVNVEGRSYAVEVRYRPLHEEDEDAPSLPEAVQSAVEELQSDSHGIVGDALVFLPGEKQIVETRDQLNRRAGRDWEVLPLFSRLSAAEQDLVFAPHRRRRVILATNVAETSLTIPGVRFVIDSGLARISRYSPRSKFQRLPIEPVSRASADQRKGRCGREGEGICIRLYSEEDYESRAQYTDPEILRTNLASLILQMSALSLGAPEDFPFLDPPDARLLNDGYRLLQELGAVDGDRRITRLGRRMAGIPVDPRLARFLIESQRTGCLPQALVIASFLSIQDPRERPAEKTEAADERHAQFADERSDFVAILNMWTAMQERTAGPARVLRHWCKENFLSYPRLREWMDLQAQLSDLMDVSRNTPFEKLAPSVLHQAVLTGFLGGIGVLDEDRSYLGARDTRFVIAPGTPLQKRSPRWLVAASLVETHRLYARTVAQVQPAWIESAAAHLVKRSYSDPQWDERRGMAILRETVSLYGRILSSGRRVPMATVEPAAARRMFVDEALVAGRSRLRAEFLARNAARRSRIERLETKLRRRDLLASDERLVEFYVERIPLRIGSVAAFETWWREQEPRDPQLLDAPDEVLLARPLPLMTEQDYPDELEVDGNLLRVHYVFDPTRDDDGVTLDVPRLLLHAVHAERLEWLVPGLLEEKVVALLRGLPKSIRRKVVPVPDAARRFVESLHRPGEGSLYEALSAFLAREAGEPVAAELVAGIPLPQYLRFNLRVLDANGRSLRSGRGLQELREQLRAAPRSESPAAAGHAWRRGGIRSWDFGGLPEECMVEASGLRLRMYPGLEDANGAARLELFTSPAGAARATRQGVVRLAALALSQQHAMVRRALTADRELMLLAAATGQGRSLLEDAADRAIDRAVVAPSGSLPRSAEDFDALIESGRARVVEEGEEVARVLRNVLLALRDVRRRLEELSAPAFAGVRTAVERQVEELLPPGWLRTTTEPWFGQLPKYLRAAARRLERVRGEPERERRSAAALEPVEASWRHLEEQRRPDADYPELDRLRWMLEEFRVSLYAQDLRTLMPVSVQRLERQLELARRESTRG